MDQKEIHINEITNKINSIKNLYEKNRDINRSNNSRLKFGEGSQYQEQLSEFEENRKKNKFSDVTSKFYDYNA